jgi:hypothetical protein
VCVFDETTDKRRKEALKRKTDENELFHYLIETIRHSDDAQATQLLAAIRGSTSLPDTKACIEELLSKLRSTHTGPSPELMRFQEQIDQMEEPRPSFRRKVLDVRRLSDDPPYRVPASPWTDVTDDDDLVSHLISLWFTWHHPWHNWLDSKLFLQAMQSGKREAEFCSPLLVNAILADACVGDPLHRYISTC